MKKDKLIDSRNKSVYDSVRENYKVNLKRSSDHDWGSNVEKDTFIIWHSPTKYPISAFTHELLHADTQLNGYKRIRAGVSLNPETHNILPRICSCLDNEMQHHKMFDKFISLGFPAEEFYNDQDSKVIPYLEDVLNTAGQSLISLSVDYLTLIAPGGVIPKEKFEELKASFLNYDNCKYRDNFKEIDKIIANWKSDKNYDAEKYIVQIFQKIDAGQTWISYSSELSKGLTTENFPSTGFFTDNIFTIEELAKAFGQA